MFPERATLLPPGLVLPSPCCPDGPALLAQGLPLLITRLLGLALLTSFLLGECLIRLLSGLAGRSRSLPGCVFELALGPDLAALSAELPFLVAQSSFCGLQ